MRYKRYLIGSQKEIVKVRTEILRKHESATANDKNNRLRKENKRRKAVSIAVKANRYPKNR